MYRKVSDIRRALVGNEIFDDSDSPDIYHGMVAVEPPAN